MMARTQWFTAALTVVFFTACDVRSPPDSGTGGGSAGGSTGGVSGGAQGGTAGGVGGSSGGALGGTSGGATGGALGGTSGGAMGGTVGGAGGGAAGGSVGGTSGGTAGGVSGGAGGGSTGGSAGGTGGGGGGGGTIFGWDGGTTIDAVKNARFCDERIRLENVIVTAVESVSRGNQGDWRSRFWIADRSNPRNGIQVDKFFTDVPGTYAPDAGDVLNIDGYIKRQSRFNDRIGYRSTIGSNFTCPNYDGGVMSLTLVATDVTPPDNQVDNRFGNADGGHLRPAPERAGTRVSIPGPLLLTDFEPPAFRRISLRPDDTTIYGFATETGVLVNNFATFDVSLSDGGTFTRCDWRKIAADGGGVRFPNGIRGIWDTYTHAPCRDGGTSCSDGSANRDAGIVPGTNNDYTYVLYPITCDDIRGEVQ